MSEHGPGQTRLRLNLVEGIPMNMLESFPVRCASCRRVLPAADAWLDRTDPRRAYCDPCYYTRFGRQPWLPLWAPAKEPHLATMR